MVLRMRIGYSPLICSLILFSLILGGVMFTGNDVSDIPDHSEVQFVYATSGIMPQLLNTSQVDAFFVWESVVSTAEMGGIGRVIARDADIPPDRKWENTACNVLVMRNSIITEYPEIASLLSAITIAGIKRIHENPDEAINITAGWVYGSQPIRSAGLLLNPLALEKNAFPHINFTYGALLPDLGYMQKALPDYEKIPPSPSSWENVTVLNRALELLNGSEPVLSNIPLRVRIGYLPSSDLYAPLYVSIMESEEICDRYGFCLVPVSHMSGRPTECELRVNNKTVTQIQLLPGQVGGGVMTGLGQNAIDVAYIGSVPSLMQMSMGNPASIIHSINAGGSGLVVDDSAPCTDWDSFIEWVKIRSSSARPLILAVPQSSIQEEMMREAFEYEGIQISLYGLPKLGVL